MGKIELIREESIIQFGTGVLLRALPDFLIEKANSAGLNAGKVVAVKSTSSDVSLFKNSNCEFTVIEKGIRDGNLIRNPLKVRSVSRVLAAETQWEEVLDCARNPEISIVISNTTEAGLTYRDEDFRPGKAPQTFPGKLAACLFERFRTLGGKNTGMVVLPCELVVDNGRLLKEMVIRHSKMLIPAVNGSAKAVELFIDWIENENIFCNTLVDRIVPGGSEPGDLIKMDDTEYIDPLHTAAEPYLLWVIQGPESLKSKLKFVQADERIIITDNIQIYRERKLRILNGSNTHVAGVGFLAGCNTTFDTMEDSPVHEFTSKLILEEIVPTISGIVPDAVGYAHETMDRFRNPEIRYPLLQVALQYSSKMNSRNTETFFRFYEQTGKLPILSCLGLASFFVFYIPAGKKDGSYYGVRKGEPYNYRDDHTDFICGTMEHALKSGDFKSAVNDILKNTRIFTRDLSTLPGLTELICTMISDIRKSGMRKVLETVLQK